MKKFIFILCIFLLSCSIDQVETNRKGIVVNKSIENTFINNLESQKPLKITIYYLIIQDELKKPKKWYVSTDVYYATKLNDEIVVTDDMLHTAWEQE
jgi:hypothetical protein